MCNNDERLPIDEELKIIGRNQHELSKRVSKLESLLKGILRSFDVVLPQTIDKEFVDYASNNIRDKQDNLGIEISKNSRKVEKLESELKKVNDTIFRNTMTLNHFHILRGEMQLNRSVVRDLIKSLKDSEDIYMDNGIDTKVDVCIYNAMNDDFLDGLLSRLEPKGSVKPASEGFNSQNYEVQSTIGVAEVDQAGTQEPKEAEKLRALFDNIGEEYKRLMDIRKLQKEKEATEPTFEEDNLCHKYKIMCCSDIALDCNECNGNLLFVYKKEMAQKLDRILKLDKDRWYVQESYNENGYERTVNHELKLIDVINSIKDLKKELEEGK